MRVHRPWTLALALFYIVLGTLRLALGGDPSMWGMWIVAGLVWTAVAFRRPPPESPAVEGPNPLRATPTGRFRATGWPPSKEPGDYR
ncbi:hypothetical protein [Conexibacter woesei]|uniref:hypothetical protein n=1 Tax=Conexibacter woesei TaxID=191495 RepID=UPI00054D00BF|nr:hypothetical protein [Conexibacter woesei]